MLIAVFLNIVSVYRVMRLLPQPVIYCLGIYKPPMDRHFFKDVRLPNSTKIFRRFHAKTVCLKKSLQTSRKHDNRIGMVIRLGGLPTGYVNFSDLDSIRFLNGSKRSMAFNNHGKAELSTEGNKSDAKFGTKTTLLFINGRRG